MTEPSILIHPSEETQNFLQVCSRSDKESAVYRNMGIKFEEEAEDEQRVKIYQDMEVDYNLKTYLQLSKHRESVMASAVAPKLRTLEAIKKEIALRSELRQNMQEANERHLREYDAMKDKHNKTLEKFFDDCLQEKNKIVKDALYAKAKVIAAVEMANLNPNMEFSSADMFKRMLQKTESTLEEVEAKHKKSLGKMPNSECNVCFVDFFLKRKRACFDPCGHTGTCIDCGM